MEWPAGLGQEVGVFGVVPLHEAGHEGAGGFDFEFFLAGEGEAGAGELVGQALAAQGLVHEGVGEVDNVVGGAGVGQLGGVAVAGGGEFLVGDVVLNGHGKEAVEVRAARPLYGKPNECRRIAYRNPTTAGPARLVFITFTFCSMNTPTTPENDQRPQDQQDRAAAARPNPNDPATSAASPNYGEFGHADRPAAAHTPTSQGPGRSGSNDNPDEFSEFSDREKDANNAPDNPEDQPGHIEQNQNPAAVRAAQGKDNEDQRAAWAADDPRYAGGGTHNTREEDADAKYPDNDK